jgi:type IV secretory pathway ATPase VirB11/archaellum biosynthesis ATPase
MSEQLTGLADLDTLGMPVASPPGRRRGTFSLTDPLPASAAGTSADGQPAAVASPRVAVPPAASRAPGSDAPWAALAESMTSSLVAEIRQRAADRLHGSMDGVPVDDQREQARPVVAELVSAAAVDAVHTTGRHWTQAQTAALVQVVLDEMFGLGRLQPLVDDDRVNNISICGHDDVMLELADGRRVRADPVADSDEDLTDFIRFLAGRDERNPREFSRATPTLRMNIDDRIRLAATAWVVPRPSVVIRRHRLVRITLDDLVAMGSLTPLAARFLAAAVKDGRSIVVAGQQNAGKTTLVRALCAEIPFHEVVVTVESERELFLHELADQHIRVFPFEARKGSSELRPDGTRAGQFTLQDALVTSKAMSADRQIVGEVLGAEVLDMLEAMRSSRGSISTVHADSASATVGRLASLAMRSGPHITSEYATREVVSGIDLVVFVNNEVTVGEDGSPRTRRWVSDILAIAPGEGADGTATTPVFACDGSGGARPRSWPDGLGYDRLARHGFDRAAFDEARVW